MSNMILDSLLKEYAQKKLIAELDLEKRKDDLYDKYPTLQKIEDDLNQYAILTAKRILNKEDYSIEDLNNKINNLKKEKEDFLKEHNIDLSYLKPFYDCPACEDTGYIKEDYKMKMCSCLKQKLLDYSFNKSNMSNLEKENFNAFNPNLFSDKIDNNKYNINISPRENIINIKNSCQEFIYNFDDANTKNLLFVGNTGLR